MGGCELSRFSCVRLCDPMNRSPSGFSVHGIFQARILEWVAISFSRALFHPGLFSTLGLTRITCISCIGRQILYHWSPLGSPWGVAAAAKSLQSCPTLCDPMACSLPGSSVHGIFQARVLEWGAIAFSKKQPKILQIWRKLKPHILKF